MRLQLKMTTNSMLAPAVALTGLLLAPDARADEVYAWYTDENNFHYEISHMPDFDQKRNDLRDDNGCCSTPGCMHCVPTSALNMVAYIANHGFPSIPPGDGFWYHEDYYQLSTTMLGFMGIVMGTNDDGCGTKGTEASAGLTSWMSDYPEFTVNAHFADDDFVITFEKIAQSLIGGNLGTMSYGRYNVLGADPIIGVPVVDRAGGHATTVIRCFADGPNDKFMWVCNPADDDPEDLDTEHPSNISVYTPTLLLVRKGWSGPYKVMTAINYPSDDGQIRFMDGHRTIRPLTCLTSSVGEIWFVQPDGFTGHSSPPGGPFPAPGALDVLSLACQPETVQIYAVLGDATTVATVYELNRVTEEWTTTGELGDRLLTGRQRQVYVVALDNRIRCFPGGNMSAAFVETFAPYDVDLIAFDDKEDEFVAVSISDYKLMRFDKDLANPPSVTDISPAIPLHDIKWLAINPIDGELWFAGLPTCLFSTDPLGVSPTTLCHPDFNNVTCVDFDSAGRMYTVDGGLIEAFKSGEGVGGWVRNFDSGFNGEPVTGQLCMMRSRSNEDPAIHDSNAWQHIPVDELYPLGEVIPMCLGDLDGDGDVDAADLATLLGAWGPNPGHLADLNGDDDVNAADLAALLGNWGPCDY